MQLEVDPQKADLWHGQWRIHPWGKLGHWLPSTYQRSSAIVEPELFLSASILNKGVCAVGRKELAWPMYWVMSYVKGPKNFPRSPEAQDISRTVRSMGKFSPRLQSLALVWPAVLRTHAAELRQQDLTPEMYSEEYVEWIATKVQVV